MKLTPKNNNTFYLTYIFLKQIFLKIKKEKKKEKKRFLNTVGRRH